MIRMTKESNFGVYFYDHLGNETHWMKLPEIEINKYNKYSKGLQGSNW